ncbi:MAG: hypothetical protein DRJ03_31170, partial [Chloroflexi bacterium]
VYGCAWNGIYIANSDDFEIGTVYCDSCGYRGVKIYDCKRFKANFISASNNYWEGLHVSDCYYCNFDYVYLEYNGYADRIYHQSYIQLSKRITFDTYIAYNAPVGSDIGSNAIKINGCEELQIGKLFADTGHLIAITNAGGDIKKIQIDMIIAENLNDRGIVVEQYSADYVVEDVQLGKLIFLNCTGIICYLMAYDSAHHIDNITIEEVSIYGGDNQGFYAYYVNDLKVGDIYVNGVSYNGVLIKGCKKVKIKSIRSVGVGYHGCYIRESEDVHIVDIDGEAGSGYYTVAVELSKNVKIDYWTGTFYSDTKSVPLNDSKLRRCIAKSIEDFMITGSEPAIPRLNNILSHADKIYTVTVSPSPVTGTIETMFNDDFLDGATWDTSVTYPVTIEIDFGDKAPIHRISKIGIYFPSKRYAGYVKIEVYKTDTATWETLLEVSDNTEYNVIWAGDTYVSNVGKIRITLDTPSANPYNEIKVSLIYAESSHGLVLYGGGHLHLRRLMVSGSEIVDLNKVLKNLSGFECDLIPTQDAVYNIGTSTKRIKEIHTTELFVEDLHFKNKWKIIEHNKYGIILISPDGKKYKFKLEEVNE